MTALQTISFIGEDTEVIVCFDYTPYQPAIAPPSTSAGPAWDETIEINQVLIGLDDILPHLNKNCIRHLEEYCSAEVSVMRDAENESDEIAADHAYEQMKERRES